MRKVSIFCLICVCFSSINVHADDTYDEQVKQLHDRYELARPGFSPTDSDYQTALAGIKQQQAARIQAAQAQAQFQQVQTGNQVQGLNQYQQYLQSQYQAQQNYYNAQRRQAQTQAWTNVGVGLLQGMAQSSQQVAAEKQKAEERQRQRNEFEDQKKFDAATKQSALSKDQASAQQVKFFLRQYDEAHTYFSEANSGFWRLLTTNQLDIKVSDLDPIKTNYSLAMKGFSSIDTSGMPDAKMIVDKMIQATTIESNAFPKFDGNIRQRTQPFNIGGAFWSGLVWNDLTGGLKNNELTESFQIYDEVNVNYLPAFKESHKDALLQK